MKRLLLMLAALPFAIVGVVLLLVGIPVLVAACLLWPFPVALDRGWPPIPGALPDPPQWVPPPPMTGREPWNLGQNPLLWTPTDWRRGEPPKES